MEQHYRLTDRMARFLDETFEMLVVAQHIARHGGVEAVEVSIFLLKIFMS
jgi:hypothetical protein